MLKPTISTVKLLSLTAAFVPAATVTYTLARMSPLQAGQTISFWFTGVGAEGWFGVSVIGTYQNVGL